MTKQRFFWICRLMLMNSSKKRSRYAKRAGIYAHIGENVGIPRFVPLYSQLIYFHNNIIVARNVDFVTHDVIHGVLNRIPEKVMGGGYREHIGCIEIMDNVFIGSNSVILYGTRIGPNVIIGSGSVVTRDCEPNSVYAGVPARRIGSFDDYVEKRRRQEEDGEISITTHNQALTKEEVENAWETFRRQHSK